MSEETQNGQSTASPDVISRMVERDITIVLSQKEFADLGESAAAIHKEMTDLEEEKKQVVSDFTGRIGKKKAERDAILGKIEQGEVTELRMVREERDYNAATVRLFVNVVGGEKLVEERAMEGDELQKDLFLRSGQSPDDYTEVSPEDAANTPDPVDMKKDLEDVIRDETRKGTKHSAVDGPAAHQ